VADFNDQLNSILSNPDAMSQIMQLAQSLSGEQEEPQAAPPPPPKPTAQPGGDLFSSLAGGIDPGLMIKLLPLIRELGSPQNSNARQLLYALRPYLKSERQEKVERALQLARLFHMGKKFLTGREGFMDV